MTTWTSLFPDEAVLLSRVFKKTPGQYNVTVPAGATYMRAHALGCGGQGDHWGGSGAYAKSVVPVNAGDNILVQVGDTSTSSTPGDSWVKRNDGTVVCYADRGRGVGTRGLASNSIGDVTYDGQDGDQFNSKGGAVTSDQNDYDPVFGPGAGANWGGGITGFYGAGGHLIAQTENGNFVGYVATPAGSGIVCLEFFNANPNY